MTVKTTLSFTDRHHQFLSEKVGRGVFATQSAAVAAALEQMMQDEQERDVALSALAQEIRARMETPREAFTDQDDAFAAARRTIETAPGARTIASGTIHSSCEILMPLPNGSSTMLDPTRPRKSWPRSRRPSPR